jgi:hypothetical protein
MIQFGDFVRFIDDKKRVHLNMTYEMFKANHYKGNFKKNKAFDKFLSQKIGEIHRVLGIWNNLSISKKL